MEGLKPQQTNKRWRGISSSSLRLLRLMPTLVLCFSCSPSAYRERAEKEVSKILETKEEQLNEIPAEELVLQDTRLLADTTAVEGLQTKMAPEAFLGSARERLRSAKVLPLEDALATAVTYSPDYLTEKESVFLEALALTLARYQLTPIFSAGGDFVRAGDSRASALSRVVSRNTFTRRNSAGVTMLQRTGARITADFTQDFLRFLGGRTDLNQADVLVSLTQPLLQGAGSRVTLEALTQEERNTLYALRAYADFRRAFIVDVVSAYYGLLRARDQVKNSYLAYDGFRKNIIREEALAEENRRTQTQLGQLRQATLQSESRWLNAVRSYEEQLDRFKTRIGLPVATHIVPSLDALDKLSIGKPPFSREQAFKIALRSRLDLTDRSSG